MEKKDVLLFLIGTISVLLILGIFISAVGTSDYRSAIESFCPQGYMTDGKNLYCEGRPFVCSEDKCVYVLFEQE